MSKRYVRPYIDRGTPGTLRYQGGVLLTVREPEPVERLKLRATPSFTKEPGIDVDAALERWAQWVKDGLAGAGWPNKTLLARVIEYGALGAAQRHYGSIVIIGTMIEYDEICGWVEAAVMRLAGEEREVIVRVYFRWETPDVSAKELGISRGTFDSRLSRGRRSVKDYLDGRKAAALALQEKTA